MQKKGLLALLVVEAGGLADFSDPNGVGWNFHVGQQG
jgi:hypothetical protein